MEPAAQEQVAENEEQWSKNENMCFRALLPEQTLFSSTGM